MSTPSDSLVHLAGHHGDFAEFAALMQKTSLGRFSPVWWGVWHQYVAPSLTQGGTVVDLGCGPGGLFPSLRQHHPDVRIVGVELQPAMLSAARGLIDKLGVEIVEADLAGPLPLPDAHADAVTAVMVLHELPFPIPALREAWRILRPGGALLVYDWARQPLREYAQGEVLDAGRLQHFREHCLYTPADLAYLLETAGFQIQEVIGRRDGGYAMLAAIKPAPSAPT